MSSHGRPRNLRIATSVARVMYTNAVYFLNSQVYQGDTPAMLNYSCVNRVYYAYARIGSDGGVFLSDEWADTKAPVDGVQGALGSFMQLKQHHPHLQVVLSIGGESCSDVFPVVAGNASLRDNFSRSASQLVEASGLDGIDVAWNSPCNAEQGKAFLALLETIRLYLPANHYILTAALPATRTVLQLIDFVVAAHHLDFINLMAYDFFEIRTLKSGHHSQLYAMSADEPSGSSGVSYLMSHGVPSSRILLGIPMHGCSFRDATGPGQILKGGGGGNKTFEYRELPRDGCRETVDKRHISAQCVGGDGGLVAYDNPDTVRTKAAFAKQKGLGGLFYWDGSADSMEKSRSLVAAGFRALHTS